jgi:hypothetical protein
MNGSGDVWINKHALGINALVAFVVAPLFFFFAVTAIIGGMRGYSPVPFWDMWNGYLGFYTRLQSGEFSVWWMQHNEHRIILTRILFWLDIHFLHGSGAMLIVVNYLLVGMSAVMYMLFGRAILPKGYLFVAVIASCWLMFWSQENNLTWGFQSQFIMAQLLPLVALYFLFKSKISDNKYSYFIGALVFGVLSFGTMANGVAALPVVIAYAILVKYPWRRIACLAFIFAIFAFLYFSKYKSPPSEYSTIDTVINHPMSVLKFYLVYLGSPFYYALGGFRAAAFAGIFCSFSTLMLLFLHVRRPGERAAELALLAFLGYLSLTAFATAGGRSMTGIEQAVSSRYTTPAVMAWAALFVLLAPLVVRWLRVGRVGILIALTAVTLCLVPFQLQAMRSKADLQFEWWVAALALKLGIADRQIDYVFPSRQWALDVARVPAAEKLSVFGSRQLVDDGVFALRSGTSCQVVIDEVRQIAGASYVSILGSYSGAQANADVRGLSLRNSSGIEVGRLLLDQRSGVGPAKVKGYVTFGTQGQSIVAQDLATGCAMTIDVPIASFETLSKFEAAEVTASASAIVRRDGWSGADFAQSRFDGLIVLGTGSLSDKDVGAVDINLKRGDRILLRTGPNNFGQTISLNGAGKLRLPISTEWVMLDFSNPLLPETFTATFEDQGQDWGAWSAIAVVQ